jgi:hypothetical protein
MAPTIRADDAPILSLSLLQGSSSGNDIFQLNWKSFSGYNSVKVTTFETEREVTLVCNGLDVGDNRKLDLREALQSGLIAVFEVGKDNALALPSTGSCQPGHMNVPPRRSRQSPQIGADIQTDSRDQTWKEMFQPGKTYELRLSESKGEAWAYYTDAEHSEVIPQSSKLTGTRDTSPTVRFTIRDSPAPPTLSAKLLMPETCHASGTPPFTLAIEFSTDSAQTITLDKSRTPLTSFEFGFNAVEQLLDCKDAETGEEVDWPATFGCFDGDPRPDFPDDEDFVELGPHRAWRFEYTIRKNGDLDESGSSSMGGLEELEMGRSYEAQIAQGIRGFSRWMYGKKEDLLKGDVEEKKKRWKIDDTKTGYLEVFERGEPVLFKVVD